MRINAVLERELRSRMRNWRAPLSVTIYVGVLAAIGFAFFYLNTRHRSVFVYQIGAEMYILLAVVQFILLAFVVPALTAGAISGEKERQTFDILISTRISATGVVLGKLASSLSFILLLIIATLPLFSLVFLLGGVSLYDLGMTFFTYLISTLYLAVWGIFFSSVFKKNQIATVAAYLMTLFLGGGVYLIAAFIRAYLENSFTGIPWLIYLSPTTSLLYTLPGGVGYDVFQALGNLSRGGTAANLDWIFRNNLIVEGVIMVVLTVLTVNLVKPVKRWSWLSGFRGRRGRNVSQKSTQV